MFCSTSLAERTSQFYTIIQRVSIKFGRRRKATNQRTSCAKSVRQHEADEARIDASGDERDNGKHGSDEDDRGTDELESDCEPPVDRDGWKVADLVPVHTPLIVRYEECLLSERADRGEPVKRLGEPCKGGRARDRV